MHRLLATLLLLAATPASASPISFAVTAHGSALELAFHNETDQPVTMTTHVRAGIDHFDWLTVKLTSSKHVVRTLQFIEDRTKAAPIDETIAPHASLSESVDVAAWAIRASNGEPLAPDRYAVEATWDTTTEPRGPKVKLTATTTLVLAAPVEKPCEEPAASQGGLELLVHQLPGTATLEIGLHNIDSRPHCVAARIATTEIQSDWLTVALPDHVLHFDDTRDKSIVVTAELAPGATSWTRWDLAAWSQRKRNGAKPLPHTTVDAIATYDASSEAKLWHGRLQTSFGLKLP